MSSWTSFENFIFRLCRVLLRIEWAMWKRAGWWGIGFITPRCCHRFFIITSVATVLDYYQCCRSFGLLPVLQQSFMITSVATVFYCDHCLSSLLAQFPVRFWQTTSLFPSFLPCCDPIMMQYNIWKPFIPISLWFRSGELSGLTAWSLDH